MYSNVDQLVNKRDELLVTISDDAPDIMLLTECIPKAQKLPICPALLTVPGYSLFTSFSTNAYNLGRAGSRGICIYVKSSLQATEISLVETDHIEQLWIKVKLTGTDQLVAGCLYRSPSASPVESIEEIANLFHIVHDLNPSHLLICGDFNIPQIDWALHLCLAHDTHIGHRFLSIVHECLLFQHVLYPTRFREGEMSNTLDLILTNEEHMVSALDYQPGLGKSDHVVLRFRLACYASRVSPSHVRLNFHKADFHQLNAKIEAVDWKDLNHHNIETGYEMFKKHLSKAVKECIPTSRSSRSRKNIYMNSKALKLKNLKLQLWHRYLCSHEPLDLVRFTRCRNKLRGFTRKLRKQFERRLVSDIKANPRAFWRYTNTRLKTRCGIGALRNGSGELECQDEKKAGILNSFFGSVFTREDPNTAMPNLSIDGNVPEISDVDISPTKVRLKLDALNPASSPGPDDVHPRVLRETRTTLSTPLAMLFRKSLDTGTVPHDWTLARIVPIYKKGCKQDASNYRPVSLTSVICKVLESLIRDAILQHLISNDLLSNTQHGFRPKRSCSTQLVDVLDAWSKAIEEQSSLDILYLDFQKAFDSVSHRLLLYKLSCYGIHGKLHTWIKSFLTARQQQVAVNGAASDWIDVASGVPQGSVLGPLLFLVYINDLPDTVQCPLRMFADDAKVFSQVDNDQDAARLQEDLEALSAWSDAWLMPFNESKCSVLHIGHANHSYQYTMNSKPIASTQVEKDLGVLVDSDLKFRQQAASAVAKATQMLAVIRRSFALMDDVTIPLLFKTLVRPHLEFGNLIWGPFNRADQKAIERVQRRATRLVSGLQHLPYQDRLRSLGLPSLYYRRKRGDMIFTYQLFHNGVDADPKDFFCLASNCTTRGHPFKVQKPTATCRVRRSAYAVRVINDWNSLPSEVVCASTVNAFKSRLDAHWAHLWYHIPDTG